MLIKMKVRFSYKNIIYDVNGKSVKQGVLTRYQTKIDLDDFNSGFYVFSITQQNGKVVAKKFIKQ